MLIKIPGNERTEEINLPNGQFVRIMYLQENHPLAMLEEKYSAPYRIIQLFDKEFFTNSEKEGAKLLGEHIEKNPYYDPNMVLTVFEHLDEGPTQFE